MFDETSLDGLFLLRLKTPLTRRLLVYFHSAAYSLFRFLPRQEVHDLFQRPFSEQ
jgi:hypothetical protein